MFQKCNEGRTKMFTCLYRTAGQVLQQVIQLCFQQQATDDTQRAFDSIRLQQDIRNRSILATHDRYAMDMPGNAS